MPSHFQTHAPKTPIALTIAGFDPSGGAGVLADTQVFAAHGIFGIAAITAQTVQSTQGVSAVQPSDPILLANSMQSLFADMPPSGVKIGMLATARIAKAVGSFLTALPRSAANKHMFPMVLDPVITSSSGACLLTSEGQEALTNDLLPLVDWLTPNWAELATLTGLKVDSISGAKAAADRLAADYPRLHIVVTGGDQAQAIDILRTPGGRFHVFQATRIESAATHGTGCAFSSALLANLIHGAEAQTAVSAAKAYVSGAIRNAPGLGAGRGPLNFFWRQQLPGGSTI